MEFEVEGQRVGQRLKAWRTQHDLSGADVAAKVEERSGHSFDWPALRTIESGDALPDPLVADALAEIFERPIGDLIGPATPDELAADAAAAESRDLPDYRPEELRLRSPYRPRRPAEGVEAWDLAPGARILRADLTSRYGGGKHARIGPCRETPNVLLFSDPTDGPARGLFDRWDDDGSVFLFAGDGLKGDQQFVRGNSAILHHRKEGRALRLFEGSSGTVTYAGEFELGNEPYMFEQAREVGGPMRQVIRFRLAPLD